MPRKVKSRKSKARSREVNLRGSGAFTVPQWWRSVQSASKTKTGRAVMRGVTQAADRFLPGSGLAVKGMRNLFGLGAYNGSLKSNSLLASPVPRVNSVRDRGIRISHHEYIGDISSTVAFNAGTYPINPGISSTFPWLSNVASNFQKYIMHGLVFVFRSTSADALNSTNTALGYVAGAVEYNVYESAPSTKALMLNISGARDGNPADDNVYPIECSGSITNQPVHFVRNGGVSDDLAKYDLGAFYLATGGSQAAAVIGELHVSYDVTLIEPSPVDATIGVSGAHYLLVGANNTNPDGTSVTKQYDILGATFVFGGSPTITVPGNGHVIEFIFQYIGTGAAVVSPTIGVAGCTAFNLYASDTVSGLLFPANGVTTAQLSISKAVKTTIGTNAVISVGTGGTLPSALTTAELFINDLGPAPT